MKPCIRPYHLFHNHNHHNHQHHCRNHHHHPNRHRHRHTTYSSIYQSILAISSIFQLIPVFPSLFQHILAYKESCTERYIGPSFLPLKKRISEHKGYITSIFPTQATWEHFNLPGHSINNVTVKIIEKVRKNNKCYRN